MCLVKKVQSKLRIKTNIYLVKPAETGIIWLLFLFELVYRSSILSYKSIKSIYNNHTFIMVI